MRRAVMSGLLIVCLGSFLCPAIAKSNVIAMTKAPACCSKMSACKMAHEKSSDNRCGGGESQRRSCCTISCSTLILFCPTSDGFSNPRFTGHAVFTGDATASTRIERPPIPPPRA